MMTGIRFLSPAVSLADTMTSVALRSSAFETRKGVHTMDTLGGSQVKGCSLVNTPGGHVPAHAWG